MEATITPVTKDLLTRAVIISMRKFGRNLARVGDKLSRLTAGVAFEKT